MARLIVCDHEDAITADIEAGGAVLGDALNHDLAESLIRCAVLAALAALAEGGSWPEEVLHTISDFMGRMRQEVQRQRLQ